MSHVGHVWSVRWPHHHDPPEGLPRVLAEVFVPSTGGARPCPPEIASYPRPQGYSVYCGALDQPINPLPPEKLAKLRRQRLERRVRAKAPMFAEMFVAEQLDLRKDYYEGTLVNPPREAVLAEERERFAFLTARPGQLIEYGRVEAI